MYNFQEREETVLDYSD